MKKIISLSIILTLMIGCCFCMPTTALAKSKKINYYSYLNKKNYKIAKAGKYRMDFIDFGTSDLPNKALGIISAYSTDIDKDGSKEMILVSIESNKDYYGYEVGKYKVSVISKNKGKYLESSYTTDIEAIGGTTITDVDIFVANGRIGLYNSYGTMLGASSAGYGDYLYEFKFSKNKIKVNNIWHTHWRRGSWYVTNEKTKKVYVSYYDCEEAAKDKKMKKMLNKAQKDTKGIFKEYFSPNCYSIFKSPSKLPKNKTMIFKSRFIEHERTQYNYCVNFKDYTDLYKKVKH